MDFTYWTGDTQSTSKRDSRVLRWILGLLALSVASVVVLVIYLQTFEREEAQRQSVADAQLLEQTVRFHFQRLEEDLTTLAQRHGEGSGNVQRGGLLWTSPKIILAHGWHATGHATDNSPSEGLMQEQRLAHPDNQQELQVMLDIARGLKRVNYAGPMLDAQGQTTDVIWVAIPQFERGQYIGSYLCALSLQRVIDTLVPTWFQNDHQLRLVDHKNVNLTPSAPDAEGSSNYAHLDLPGMDLSIHIETTRRIPRMGPRVFFAIAVLFLLGMMVSLYALTHDMRKRRRIEGMLRAQVALRTAMENSVAIGMRAWDLKGRILYVNRSFSRMVGYEAHELVGQIAPLPYWPSHQTDEMQLVHDALMRQGTEDIGVEVQFQHRDGHLVDALIHEAPLHDEQGKQVGWMSSVLDISERKRAERLAAMRNDKLETLGRLVAVGEVASTLAHELNQPLGALSSFANGLLNRLRAHSIAPDEIENVVSRMERLADKAGRIIQRVNAFARRREMTRQAMALTPFLQRLVAPFLRQPDIQWRVDTPETEIWIDADSGLLEHALRNVISNAADWAIKGVGAPQVHISCVVEADRVGLVVADSGPGVDEQDKEQIFTAFYSRKDGGMGMGLAICRSVIEAHHGQLDVQRCPALGGARITLWLPTSARAPDSQDASDTIDTP